VGSYSNIAKIYYPIKKENENMAELAKQGVELTKQRVEHWLKRQKPQALWD
jgi:hypothetical protein